MLRVLQKLLLILPLSFAAEDCGSFVVNGCDRNFCTNRIVDGIPNAVVCQTLCLLATDFECKSFAFSEASSVSLLFGKFLEMMYNLYILKIKGK